MSTFETGRIYLLTGLNFGTSGKTVTSDGTNITTTACFSTVPWTFLTNGYATDNIIQSSMCVLSTNGDPGGGIIYSNFDTTNCSYLMGSGDSIRGQTTVPVWYRNTAKFSFDFYFYPHNITGPADVLTFTLQYFVTNTYSNEGSMTPYNVTSTFSVLPGTNDILQRVILTDTFSAPLKNCSLRYSVSINPTGGFILFRGGNFKFIRFSMGEYMIT